MCGIIGGVSPSDITSTLIDGLHRLEYRGYDSAGIAVVDLHGRLARRRAVGKVAALAGMLSDDPLHGRVGIAHTRWATHGRPHTDNAHPHMSRDSVAVVHNGIVENYAALRDELTAEGYCFISETDTEVIAHLVERQLRRANNLREAVGAAVQRLEGAFTFAAVAVSEPDRLVAARQGSPLVVGIGDAGCFVASDTYALLPVARRFIYLEEGDVVELTGNSFRIHDAGGRLVERAASEVQSSLSVSDKEGFRHYMLKEIHEQPDVVARTLDTWLEGGHLNPDRLAPHARALFAQVRGAHIIACGTSYHAGLVARYWLESLGIPCHVEVASEYRYRKQVIMPGTLLVTISQSGETADTLAPLREAAGKGYLASVTVCNVPNSSLVRESDIAMLTRAGPEIGVASTKAFTAQLVALAILALALARRDGDIHPAESAWLHALRDLPESLRTLLRSDLGLDALSSTLSRGNHALFLGRGIQYPVAMEGALKLKEISYIHAEAYPAGELKHGPLALVDDAMPVIFTLPQDHLLAKTCSNLKEVQARGGRTMVFADDRAAASLQGNGDVVRLGVVPEPVAPIVFTLPLQLLAYHTAVVKGADVDQPRNLAKSVTVE
ncbi:MAG: glutamine--fructose-6-phosphate transaminase (isomerizing) [Gammaproteobacteria bacterium]|nr:glutamine--fructose-6-phosphate transaminase (isomerizing) [Gammaproteobacteria bacterium]